MSYQDVRGPDGRLLFRIDPARFLVEIVVKGKPYTIDLTVYILPLKEAEARERQLAQLKQGSKSPVREIIPQRANIGKARDHAAFPGDEQPVVWGATRR